jgi:diguanylate cyclase (GGDEF)-like protein/PAS domain S-box-containing protein
MQPIRTRLGFAVAVTLATIAGIELVSYGDRSFPASAALLTAVALSAMSTGVAGAATSLFMALAYAVYFFGLFGGPHGAEGATARFEQFLLAAPLLAATGGLLRRRLDHILRDGDLTNQRLRAELAEKQKLTERVQEMNESLQHAVEGIARLDAEGRCISVNAALARLTGRDEESLLGARWESIVTTKAQDRARDAFDNARLTGRCDVDVRCLARTGRVFDARVLLVRAQGDGAFLFLRDVTAQVEASEELKSANQKLTVLLDQQRRRVAEITTLAEISDALQSCETAVEASTVIARLVPKLFPYGSGAVHRINASRNSAEVVATWGDEHAEAMEPGDCWALRRGKLHHVTDVSHGLTCKHVSGHATGTLCVPMMAQSEALGVLHVRMGPNDPPLGEEQVKLITGVAEQLALGLGNLELREKLRVQAIRDPLTGLLNRRAMEEALDRELLRAARTGRSVAVLMLDLDHFKRFNDVHGHAAGDAALAEIGSYLKRSFRADDLVCRYGGEEIMIIMPEASLEDAARRASRVCRGVASVNVRLGTTLLPPVTVSAGLAAFPEHGSDASEILRAADLALYSAKRTGRDRVSIAESDHAQPLSLSFIKSA